MKSNINQLSFRKRGIPIPADYRPLFKIGHIVMILAMACRSNKSSMMKLHFVSWAIKSKRNIQTVEEWIKTNFKSDYHIWGVEPTVNRALLYGKGEGLIENILGDYALTEKGLRFYKAIKDNKDLFEEEKAFLESIGKNGITEQRIKDLTSKFF